MSGSRPRTLLAACSARPLAHGDSAVDATSTGDTTSTGGTTASPGTGAPTTSGVTEAATDTTATTGAAGTTDGASDTADASGGNFIPPQDLGPLVEMCDVLTQNCPEGQKCAPYSGDGDWAWDSTKCVDVVPSPAGLYEPCTAGPISTGEDTCDKGLMCWDIDLDTGVGYCVAHCTGSPDEPTCVDPKARCVISAASVLMLCLPMCDPILQDCNDGDVCIPDPNSPDKWICVLDASGDEGQVFDPCEYANACDPGLFCADPSVASECDPKALGCCNPFCDLTQPNTCPGQGQQCLPWYEPGEALPDYEHVGYCALPEP